MQTTFEELRALEDSLWKAETRYDKSYIDRIFADDFFEFGRSGRIHSREQCVAVAGPGEINASFPLKNFKVTELTSDVFLVTYQSEVQHEDLEISNRSSIWHKTQDGWKLRFHQGTPA